MSGNGPEMQSYGGEDEWVKKDKEIIERGKDRRMANGNGNGKVSWEFILKISQVLVIPLLGLCLVATLYVINGMSSLDKRLALIEENAKRPIVDVALAQKIAVIEDRQNAVRAEQAIDKAEIRRLGDLLQNHRDRSTYDGPNNKFR